MPPPTPNKSGKAAEKAPSQQESNFDLKSHPNGMFRSYKVRKTRNIKENGH